MEQPLSSLFASPASFAGLEHLATAVILLDKSRSVIYANPGAEVIFALSAKQISGLPLSQVFPGCEILHAAVENAIENHSPFREHEFIITTLRQNSLAVTCTVTPVDLAPACLVLEFQQMDQQLRIAREERMLIQQQANAELLRNLAHEIRNPLGGLRGAAQLLEHELPQVSLREYTQVIIKEADRLQSLMDRLLVPHRVPKYEPTNIHEVLHSRAARAAGNLPARRAHPRRQKHSVGEELQRRWDVQERGGSEGALRRAGDQRRRPRDCVLPHRRAVQPHVVRDEVSARVQKREELRRLVDRVGESRRRRRRETVEA